MSAGFQSEAFEDKEKTTNRCSIVSIYEDRGDRDLLFGLCDSLAWTFKDDLEFTTDWWRFKYLADPEIGFEAAQSATDADLILLAARSPELPTEVKRWFETWLPNRTSPNGALVFVPSAPRATPVATYLRHTARRARLDYVPLLSTWVEDAAARLSAAQDEVNELISYHDRPQHWGINE